MSATTTLKIPEQLKSRVSVAAEASGKSAHAWMLEAIELQAELAERRQAFVAAALAAEQEVAQYGLVYDADEVFSYLKERASGTPVSRPDGKKL